MSQSLINARYFPCVVCGFVVLCDYVQLCHLSKIPGFFQISAALLGGPELQLHSQKATPINCGAKLKADTLQDQYTRHTCFIVSLSEPNVSNNSTLIPSVNVFSHIISADCCQCCKFGFSNQSVLITT